MDILAASVATTTAQRPPTAVAVPALGQPDTLATTRFAAIMAQPLTSSSPLTAVGAEATLPVVTPPAQASGIPPSLGDRILSGMNGVSSDLQGAWKTIASTLETDHGLNAQEMLKLQLHLSQVSLQYDLVGKAISRSTQNIDQLVRVQ